MKLSNENQSKFYAWKLVEFILLCTAGDDDGWWRRSLSQSGLMCEKNYLSSAFNLFSAPFFIKTILQSQKNVDCEIESKVVVRNFRNSSAAGLLNHVLEFRRKHKICFQSLVRNSCANDRRKKNNFQLVLIVNRTGWKKVIRTPRAVISR